MLNSDKKLICITSCNRISEVKNNIFNYIKFCNKREDYDFLLALDGNDEEYLLFAETYDIPLIYSLKREGVGLSKNRVLKNFPDYDYYFFIEDDVFLLSSTIFDLIVQISLEEKLHHLIAYGDKDIIEVIERTNYSLIHSSFGSAQFNFFTKHGLDAVGGWNPTFAKYKRFGHTEHSYRFYHQGLQKSPFILVQDAKKMILVFDPPHVSKILTEVNEMGLCIEEQELINQKTIYYPLQTLSPFNFNNKPLSYNEKVDKFLSGNKKVFPLLKGKKRLKVLAEYYSLQIPITKPLFKKFTLFLKSLCYNPINNALKHYVKTKLFGN